MTCNKKGVVRPSFHSSSSFSTANDTINKKTKAHQPGPAATLGNPSAALPRPRNIRHHNECEREVHQRILGMCIGNIIVINSIAPQKMHFYKRSTNIHLVIWKHGRNYYSFPIEIFFLCIFRTECQWVSSSRWWVRSRVASMMGTYHCLRERPESVKMTGT